MAVGQQQAAPIKSKLIFKVDSPYTAFQWLRLTKEQNETAGALLATLLSPIGEYRRLHAKQSKDSKTRKRKLNTEVEQSGAEAILIEPPSIASACLIGLNSVTRHLNSVTERDNPKSQPLALLFVFSDSPQKSPAFAHLPVLSKSASRGSTEREATRLVALPLSFAPQIATALNIARVSIVGILGDTEGVEPLLKFVRDKVPPVKLLWMDEALKSTYKPLKMQVVDVTPSGKARKTKDSE